MSNTGRFWRALQVIPDLGSKAVNLSRRVRALEEQIAELRAALVGMHQNGKSDAASQELQLQLTRAAHVVQELDRLNALYDSAALRIARLEAPCGLQHAPPALAAGPVKGAPAAQSLAAMDNQEADRKDLSETGLRRRDGLLADWDQQSWHVAPRPGLMSRVRDLWRDPRPRIDAFARLHALYSQLANEYSHKVDSVERLQQELHLLRSSSVQQIGRIDQLSFELEQVQAELENARAVEDELSRQFTRMLDNLEGERNRLARSDRELAEARILIQAEASRVQALAQELQDAREALNVAMTTSTGLEEEVSRLRAANAACQEQVVALVSDLDAERTAHQASRDQRAAEEERLRADLDSERTAHQASRDQRAAEEERLRADLDAERAAHQASRDQRAAEEEQLLAELDAERKRRTDVSTRLLHTETEYRTTVARCDQLLNDNNSFRRELQALRRTAGLRSGIESAQGIGGIKFPFEFTNIPGVLPIAVVDVGAQVLDGEAHAYAPMQENAACQIVGFEPLRDAAERRASLEPGVRILDHAIGVGGKATLHVCRFDPATSLIEPDVSFLQQFTALPEMCEVIRRLEVETIRLDDVPEAADCDFLKLDVQGGELDALRGAVSTLEQVMTVHIEAEFAPIYRGQPLFSDIDVFLRSAGFELMDLMRFGYGGYKELPNRSSVSRLMWCEAVYFRMPHHASHLQPLKLLKAAYIAHVNYGLYDLAANILASYDTISGSNLLPTYLKSV